MLQMSVRTARTSTMGKQNAFQLRSVLVIGLVVSCFYISTQAQPGFLSIDCGGVPYTDGATTIAWEADDNYTQTGMSGRVPAKVNSTYDNSGPLQTFTYFPEPRNKHCYELPTTGGRTFLLRAMFLHGNSAELILPILFRVAVNSTIWFKVAYNLADTYETLRELDQNGTMYSEAGISETRFLNYLVRMNCGALLSSPTLRYPDDKYDRLWYSPGASYQNVPSSTSSIANLIQPSPNHLNNVPAKVMQDAWDDDTGSSFWVNFVFGGLVSTAYMALYIQEIVYTVSESRMFDIYVNDFYTTNFTANPEPEMETYSNWLVGTQVNFSFISDPSSFLGPTVSAIEVYDEVDFNASATAAKDVDALKTLQVNFNLTTWQGDPCFPIPWGWVTCTSDVQARVTILLLSNMGINSSIPPTISNLDALTEIHLDNNSLYGAIPDSLAFLPNLAFLSLNNNDLSGKVPSDLVAKLGSNFEYLGNRFLGFAPGLAPGLAPAFAPALAPALGNRLASIEKKKSSNVGVLVAAIVGAVLVVGIVLGILIRFIRSRGSKPQPGPGPNAPPGSQKTPVNSQVQLPVREVGRISYETVKLATNNFQARIGQGSFGPVYRGFLNDRDVAVKVNAIQSPQGRKEFIAEVDILTRVHHKNLVSLVGYCDEGNELILIYEFQANGTLHEWLHGTSRSIDWKQRLEIAADAAKGLEYLHKGCTPTIIHRDVKSSNILLDGIMTAKVADFGLSKSAACEKSSGFSTGVKGTFGYLDPEYHNMGRLTHKSDVYSYGVVLAELMTGRPPFQYPTNSSPAVVLVDWMQKMVERNDIEALADPNLQGQFDSESMWRVADLALSCVNRVTAKRPDFSQVVIGLHEATEMHSRSTFTARSPISVPSHCFMSGSNHPYLNLTTN